MNNSDYSTIPYLGESTSSSKFDNKKVLVFLIVGASVSVALWYLGKRERETGSFF